MSIIEEGGEKRVRMAHLAIVGSHSVNGVAALHTEILKRELFRDFHELWPEKFNNKTNGITQRRWLLEGNPRLSALDQPSDRRGVGDRPLRAEARWSRSPRTRASSRGGRRSSGPTRNGWPRSSPSSTRAAASTLQVDPDSMFDCQVKRIHEYKRQLLNVAARRHALPPHQGRSRAAATCPRTVIFGGKAAPGYRTAKLIIRLINAVAEVVNHDPDVGDRLKVVFLADYRVSLAEQIFPAAELSEQISTAGTEASGTGNMKFALNGALTIGTMDGANIEIAEEVGKDNIFIFGLLADEVAALRGHYDPGTATTSNPELQHVLDAIGGGRFSPQQPACSGRS